MDPRLSPLPSPPPDRAARLVADAIRRFALDLDGLTVVTEAASGPYRDTPLLACAAGARVHAFTRDSSYADAEAVETEALGRAAALGLGDRLTIHRARPAERPAVLASADIVTNSGFVRPLDRALIERLPPHAVIPLMFESWELRQNEIDMAACRDHGVLVLGTDERRPPLRFDRYLGVMALRLLFELGVECVDARVAVLGAGLGAWIHPQLERHGVESTWFADLDDAARPYRGFADWFAAHGPTLDALIFAEHRDPQPLIGPDGLLDWTDVQALNPDLRVGVVAGQFDREALRTCGLRYAPAGFRPFRYMSYQPAVLGPRPVLELYAAGLAVGQAMARARRAGLALVDAARAAIDQAPAADLHGEDAWIR
jgi:hypothetical protein